MDNKMKEKQVADMLAQPAKGKRPYIAPQCKAIPFEQVSFICGSVIPQSPAPANSEEDWEEDEKDMGQYEI